MQSQDHLLEFEKDALKFWQRFEGIFVADDQEDDWILKKIASVILFAKCRTKDKKILSPLRFFIFSLFIVVCYNIVSLGAVPLSLLKKRIAKLPVQHQPLNLKASLEPRVWKGFEIRALADLNLNTGAHR